MIDSADLRRHAPATARNRDPILQVLQSILPTEGVIVEVASGTGEHASYFAPQFQPAQWLPTDADAANLDSIGAWCTAAGATNVYAPLCVDVRSQQWPQQIQQFLAAQSPLVTVTAVVNINMIHISPWAATLGLMQGAAQLLAAGGVLYLYGPFKAGEAHTAPSNAAFDQSLRSQCDDWGVRDRAEVIAAAHAQGLIHQQTLAMPANNQSIIFRKQG